MPDTPDNARAFGRGGQPAVPGRLPLIGRNVLLRSKTPRGVVQELYGLFLAHRVVRQVVADAAAEKGVNPDRLSCTATLRVIQTHLPEALSRPPRPSKPFAESVVIT